MINQFIDLKVINNFFKRAMKYIDISVRCRIEKAALFKTKYWKLRFAGVYELLFRKFGWNCYLGWNCGRSLITPETMKYWVGVKKGLSFQVWRWLFNLGWKSFYWWLHKSNTLHNRLSIMLSSLASHISLLG